MSNESQDNSRKDRPWLAILGDIEAIVSVGVLLRVLTATTVVGRQRQDMIEMCITIGIGAGLALGGVRFGNECGRMIGWIVGSVYTLLITALIVRSLILRNW